MRFRSGLALSFLVLSLTAPTCVPEVHAQAEDLSVLSGWIQWSNAANLLQNRLNSVALGMLASRSAMVNSLHRVEDWHARQADARAALQRIIGSFSGKHPLNAQVLGILSKDGYTVEKVIFESLPRFYVTGCLFIPPRRGARMPAILNVIGHTDISFRAPSYQQLLLNLVRKGFIVFAVDPVGQGERLQYYDRELKRSLVGGATAEHSYFGKQCFLTGSSAARYFTWDGIRAIDYLVSRPEVDPKRIGVTGISGGGTQTSYIAALDDRVAAAAPACYIAGFRRLLESIGPQDAEQNLNAGLMQGLDHADFLEVRAPRPTLVVSTTRDFFSIQGARETVAEARGAFRALGAEGNLSMVEDDSGHGYTKKTREAIYGFFQRHLDNPGNPADEEVELLPPQELTVTKTGQVLDSLGGETVFSLNRAEAGDLVARLEKSREGLPVHLERVRAEARRLSGYRAPEKLSGIVFRGRYARTAYHIEMYVLSGEGGCLVPVLLLLPDSGSNHRALIYLHPQGKSTSAAPGGEMEQLLKQGYAVIAPDPSGTGETGRATDAIDFAAILTGRSIVGLRAADIVTCVQFLKSRPDINAADISAVARGSAGIPLLHAAAFDRTIKKIALIEPLVSFQSVVVNRFFNIEAGSLVGNVLTAYDLPDLAACLAPRTLALVDPVDQLQNPAGRESIEKSFDVVRRSYSALGAAGNFAILISSPGRPLIEILASWLRRE
ncbi:MAG TPA: acetylxylan esterase [Acidobacteriota bacterium]|nr:acetylxylan esterase [Acidobacteriota bacterium]